MEYIGQEDYSSPVTAEIYKRATHWGEDDADDDEIDRLIEAATALVEDAARRPMMPREYEFEIPAGAWRRWWFPAAPVGEILEVAVAKSGGPYEVVPDGSYALEMARSEPQLVLCERANVLAGGSGVVRVRAMLGADRAPKQLEQAVVLLVKDWLEAQISVGETEYLKVSFGAKMLIQQKKYARPQVAA